MPSSEPEIKFNQASFLLSAAKVSQLPKDDGAEIAFIGRSNAGKSSALNALTEQKKLAKISKTPGRTQLINVFELNNQNRLIDLPGYGYAKVPDQVKKDWSIMLDKYLRQRECLRGLVLVMDARHPLQELDWQFLRWTESCDIDTHIILTKSDKLKFGQRKLVLLDTAKQIKKLKNKVSVQLFSGPIKLGIEELQQKLLDWYLE
ncbi:MAG: YihA family ribosome biogenesis GTP-binding protein [Gammaproteobacteria bacterium]|nr:YihA family ribosome biogenesis GTP-binding protein [Gammaproteobacteria bacterium]